MKYGYCICDAANNDVYQEAAAFIIDDLGYTPLKDELRDVDDSVWQTFKSGGATLKLVSDTQIGCVAIISDVELSIECLHEFNPA